MSSKANYFFKNLFRYSFLLLDFIIFVWWHLLLSQSISHGWSCNNSGIFRTIQKLSVWSRYCAGQAESYTKISVLFASFLKEAKRRSCGSTSCHPSRVIYIRMLVSINMSSLWDFDICLCQIFWTSSTAPQPLMGAKRRSLKEIRTIYLSLFTFNFLIVNSMSFS